ncbi:MAG: TonB-dependent receptor [Desulfuromonadaceae bacterium]|nr:TonB-dependent receptor [Desulfuromonadaceae bacterium]
MKKRRKQQCGLVMALVMTFCTTAGAEEKSTRMEEVVVTANRLETATAEVGSSITVITAREIEQRQQTFLLDVLRSVPSLDVVQNGGPGSTTALFMRGANSEHTLVLLDGIELNDPSSPSGGFDFANLPTDNIERIEILRGPQSTLYGSRAMGGVINIITKRGTGDPTGFFSAQGGSFHTTTEKAGISGGTDRYNYSLGLSRFDSEGFSAAGKKYGNTENDGNQNSSVKSRLGITPTNNLAIDFILNYLKNRTDLDNNGGIGGDDPNYVQKSEQLSFRSQADLALFDNRWEQRLGVSLNDLNRDFTNGIDAAHPSDLSRGSFNGRSVTVDWQHTLHLHETNSLTLGIERKEETAKSDYYSESSWGPYSSPWEEHTARTTGYYLQDQLRLWDAWFTTLGVRLDDHSSFGSKATYRFTSAYNFKQTDTTVKGSYGTAFKAPSLYQLYAPDYGDKNLNPEKSTGWDLGVEQSLPGEKITMGATYFHNDFDDLINFDSTLYKYDNIARAATQGVELTASVRPSDELMLRAGYTYTKTENKETGLELLLRPKNKISFDGNYRFLKNATLNLGIIYVGTRFNTVYDPTTYAAARVKMSEYLLANLAASCDISKNLQIFGRVDNLFDKNYEEITGYGTAGISAFGGVKVSF